MTTLQPPARWRCVLAVLLLCAAILGRAYDDDGGGGAAVGGGVEGLPDAPAGAFGPGGGEEEIRPEKLDHEGHGHGAALDVSAFRDRGAAKDPSGRNDGPVVGARKRVACDDAGGYQWCESKGRCVRSVDEGCQSLSVGAVAASDAAAHHADDDAGGHGKPGDATGGSAAAGAAANHAGRDDGSDAAAGAGGRVKSPKAPLDGAPPPPVKKRSAMLVGAQKPGQKCLASAGYVWCDGKQKCLRPFEEEC
jgi:hypothetical protein